MNEYWLSKWLDSEGIADLDVIKGVLRTKAGFDRLIEAAEIESAAGLPDLPRNNKSIVAGIGLDLSGHLSCSNPECLERTVDDLVMRSWHYFDQVVVSGLDPTEITSGTTEADREWARSKVLDHAAAALHIRDIGAEDLLTFRRKEFYCTKHLQMHATEAGLPPIVPLAKELTAELSKGSSLDFRETRRGLEYGFTHPSLDYVATGVVRNRKRLKSFKQSVSTSEARSLIAALTRDIAMSKKFGMALGQATQVNSKLITLPTLSSEPSVASVAFNVRLPVIHGANPADLMQLRREEGGEFEVFRAALRKAIEERIKSLPEDNAEALGQAILGDVIQPALAGIEMRMKRSAGLLAKRSGLALAAGGVVTTVGLLAFAPLTVPGLILAAGGMVANYNDYLKDRRDVDVSDMHFLWRTSSSRHA